MRLTAKQIPDSVGLAGDLSIAGKIIRVFDKKAGESEKGKWSFQNFICQDETGEMTVCLKNRPEEFKKEDVGKDITIESTKTSKGIFGVKVDEESYKDKDQKDQKSIKVIITPSARIQFDTTTNPSKEHTQAEPEPEIEVKPVDLDSLRKETIVTSINAYKEAFKDEIGDISNPAYPQIMNALILAAGRNADTLFIAKNGR